MPSGWESQITAARGKVLALLLHRGIDIVAAEDAVAIAIVSALEQWRSHPPANPEAWLMTVAWRKALDLRRSDRRSSPLTDLESVAAPENEPMLDISDHLPDERLRLYFLCTHPALEPTVQCPLMLQLVTGMTVEQISALYLVPAPTMAQRLVRAKRKIRDAGIQPRLPSASEVHQRVPPVLDALYGLYFSEWQGIDSPHQALELAEILADLLPGEAECLGLAALISFCESRRDARQGPRGEFIPLDDQDQRGWSLREIERAESYLERAAKLQAMGRYQLEAAIQSAHTQRLRQGSPSWATIVRLYDRLLMYAPTAGFAIGRIGAVLKAEGPAAAIVELDRFESLHPEVADSFQPCLVTRAHCLWQLGQFEEAKTYARRALTLTNSESEQTYLRMKFEA